MVAHAQQITPARMVCAVLKRPQSALMGPQRMGDALAPVKAPALRGSPARMGPVVRCRNAQRARRRLKLVLGLGRVRPVIIATTIRPVAQSPPAATEVRPYNLVPPANRILALRTIAAKMADVARFRCHNVRMVRKKKFF